jgi:hypothetical protein
MRFRSILPVLLALGLSLSSIGRAHAERPIAEFGGWGNQTTHKFEGTGFTVNWAFRCSAGTRFFQLVLHGSRLPHGRAELVNRTGKTAFGHHDVFLTKGQVVGGSNTTTYYFTVAAGKKCYWTLDVRAP